MVSRKLKLMILSLSVLAVSVGVFLNMTDADDLLVQMNEKNKLSLLSYANEGETELMNKLPNFSFAGYMGGGVPLPEIPVVKTLSPANGDALQRIQTAIDEVGLLPLDANGFRGAVLLKKGIYRVSGTIYLKMSGVVLRGEGQELNGTVIIGTKTKTLVNSQLLDVSYDYQYRVISLAGSSAGESYSNETRITNAYVPVGAKSFTVENAAIFTVGETVSIKRTPNDFWIQQLGMDKLSEIGTGRVDWTPASFTVGHERVITKIEGNKVSIDIPLVDSLQTQYGGGSMLKASLPGRISNVGVENLRVSSVFSGENDERHAWAAVSISYVLNGWVKKVTSQHTASSAVSVSGKSKYITVEDTAQIDPISVLTGGRRYSFSVGSGVGFLFQRCFSENARHAFVTGGVSTGPHVWVDSVSTIRHSSPTDDGPHQRWATGLLFDNLLGKTALNVQNRLGSGTGHGWAGAQVMFWKTDYPTMVLHAPPGAMNWAVATKGNFLNGSWSPDSPQGMKQADDPSLPRSLYFQQLQDRRGVAAVTNVTTPEQRAGKSHEIIALLAKNPAPGSDPTCANGLARDGACCDKACGSCGGLNCSQRPGGVQNCCSGNILSSAPSCLDSAAPCKIPPIQTVAAFATVRTDPTCARGVASPDGVCCPASCGTCGGLGCGNRPGGSDNCCTGGTKAKGLSCGSQEAPCLIPIGGI